MINNHKVLNQVIALGGKLNHSEISLWVLLSCN